MNRTLRYGFVGDDVKQLQAGLNLLFPDRTPLKTDGIYGSKTTAGVQHFQSAAGLVPDGVTGPLTWEKFAEFLAQLQQGGIPVFPGSPPQSALDLLRPVILTIAQQHLGLVDFQGGQFVEGRPRGLDFLIHMFQLAAGVTLSDENFIDPKTKAWMQQPWINSPHEQTKSWCGIFCVYCYKMAGLNAGWDMGTGKPFGPIQLNVFSPTFVADIRPADIGAVQTKSHHFLIESVDDGNVPAMTTLDGNQDYGRILRIWSYESKAHRVLKDNFNYYSFV